MSDAEDDYFGADNGIDRPFPFRSNRPGLSSERRHIEREMRKLQARLGELDQAADRFGDEPPVGTIIAFSKQFPNSIKTYSYVALRTGPERAVGGGWFLTGRDGSQPRTWQWLTDFIGDGPFRVIAPESGKSKAFNVLFDHRMPSNMVLVVDECGKASVGVDPAQAYVDWAAAARAARKTGIVADLAVGREMGQAGYVPRHVAAAYAKTTLEPFEAVPDGDVWRIYDRRDKVSGKVSVPVAEFAVASDGERRAKQSATDRNRQVRHEVLSLKTEPPVGARVRSTRDHQLWAQRESNGWTRFHGNVRQGVRLRWESVRRQLGSAWPGGIEPGTPDSVELF